MAVIQRFNTLERGCVVMTGNTLGLWGTFTTPPGMGAPYAANLPGSTDGIGAFTSLNSSLMVSGGYPAGTTLDWKQNGSSANINIPSDAEVLYAELIWGGTIITTQEDRSSVQNSNIKFTDSYLNAHNISPDIATYQNSSVGFGTALVQYNRSANVTDIVKISKGGTYSVEGVPGALGDGGGILATYESVNLGWSLIVAYKRESESFRNLNIWTALSTVYGPNVVDVYISGYTTPSTGIINGDLMLFVTSGDCYISGDQVKFGPNVGMLTTLSGPNNPINNFFQSQVNYADPCASNMGQLNTTGTFGNMNQPLNTGTGSLTIPNRQGTDITGVSIDGILPNGNTSSVIRLSTSGDLYFPMGIALQFEVVIPLDYGDAPDTSLGNGADNYNTLLASNGPRHFVSDSLMLGSFVTKENDAYQNSNATGDDLTQNIQDDGLLNTIKDILVGQNYSVDLYYTNSIGSNANIYAWIDFNKNGIFETNEKADSIVVTSSDLNPRKVTLNFVVPGDSTLANGDHTFMRIRITTENLINKNNTGVLEDSRSIGLAKDGEVEDYYLNVISLIIKGQVWYDINCDGIKENPVVPYEGAVVELYMASDLNTPIAFTSTDSLGNYSFTNLAEGEYYVKVIRPDGYSFTLVNVGNNDLVDSDINGTNGFSEKLSLNQNNPVIIVDAGVCRLNKITGEAFYDCNKNGIMDDNDPKLCGVLITLINKFGIEVGSVVTDCDGYYEFKNLEPGSYTVRVKAPPEMNITVQNQTNIYGSKPDQTLGEFLVNLTNMDYLIGYAGFYGGFKLNSKYCLKCSVDFSSIYN